MKERHLNFAISTLAAHSYCNRRTTKKCKQIPLAFDEDEETSDARQEETSDARQEARGEEEEEKKRSHRLGKTTNGSKRTVKIKQKTDSGQLE